MNIGIHFFDALLWLFGGVEKCEVHLAHPDRSSGCLQLERATVRWFLSVNGDDLPEDCRSQGSSAYRSIQVDGQEVDFTHGFEQLHTLLYERILAGEGFGFADARPSIELVHAIRHTQTTSPSQANDAHPLLVSS